MSVEKASLRKEMTARRAAVSADPAPALKALLDVLQNADGPVSFYWPIRTEIDPRSVMEAVATRLPVCLPVTHGRGTGLSFRRWLPGAAMETDGFGVSVPSENFELTPATLVIPMLGFDEYGQRLGYGAGHYDRTLAGLRAKGSVLAVGFAYEAQRLDHPMPAEPTDQPLDMIVTEAGILMPLSP